MSKITARIVEVVLISLRPIEHKGLMRSRQIKELQQQEQDEHWARLVFIHGLKGSLWQGWVPRQQFYARKAKEMLIPATWTARRRHGRRLWTSRRAVSQACAIYGHW